jgi:hypothetical protein
VLNKELIVVLICFFPLNTNTAFKNETFRVLKVGQVAILVYGCAGLKASFFRRAWSSSKTQTGNANFDEFCPTPAPPSNGGSPRISSWRITKSRSWQVVQFIFALDSQFCKTLFHVTYQTCFFIEYKVGKNADAKKIRWNFTNSIDFYCKLL